jgi:hypothetical protein
MKAIKVTTLVLAILLAVLFGLYYSGYGGGLAMQAFLAYNSPSGNFDPAETVPPPDYADVANWSALPGSDDLADLVPESVVPANGEQQVDTFFIHPTAYLKSASWISPMDPDSATEENIHWMMANQASAFNGCCNVYAPRYREATIFSYFVGSEKEREAIMSFAYDDVRRAFEYYMAHYNQGRPFIIAAHSQGTHHSLRLLKEVIDGQWHDQMVAAYLIGGIVVPVPHSWLDSMPNIGACEAEDDLGCVVHWDTMPEGADPMVRSQQSLCTNPLSWRVDEERADAALNQGAVIPEETLNNSFGRGSDEPTGKVFAALSAPVAGHTWAQCRDGTLFAGSQQGTPFEAMIDMTGTYHGLDYALFYMNIRNNAITRANRYLAVNGQTAL